MDNCKVRKLGENDLKGFEFIAKIHESLPAAWIDNYAIDNIEIEKTARRLKDRHTTNDIFCSVVEDNDEIIAFIWAEINEEDNKILDIISLWTSQNYRRKGIATRLKLKLESWAKAQTDAKKISTTVSSNNKNMVQMNQKLGYEIKSYNMFKVI